MKKLLNKLSYLFFLLLMASALLLAACGTAAATASAAQNDPMTINETAKIVESDTIQEDTPIAKDAKGREVVPSNQAMPNNGSRPGTPGQGGPGQGQQPIPTGDLSEVETEALLFMREEEKLARDVYLTLYELWGLQIFTNIAGSEQAHMDAIAYLLESYGLQDPAAGKEIGDFSDPQLQALYDDLTAQGQGSLEAALLVGGAIEEIDIIDLQKYMAQVENDAITQVFENLLRGSINHLNAFVTNHERQTGTVYEPQFLSQDAYDALVDTTSGRGNGPGGGNNNGGQGGGNGAAAGRGGPGSGNGRGRK